MSDNLEAQAGKKHPYPPPVVAPTFMQRLCQLLHQQVTVYLTCPGTAPVQGMLHAVGQDYIELHRGAPTQMNVTIIPLWNICSVVVAGAMDVVCPSPGFPPGYPVSPGMGMGPGMGHPGHGMGPGMGMFPGMGNNMGPGMLNVNDVKKDEEK